MINYKITAILVVLVVMIDFLWLRIIMKKFYEKELGNLMKNVNLYSAILVYFLIAFGVSIFVLNNNLGGNSVFYAIILGALFGLISYGIYDFTNYAVLKNYSLKLVVVDILWGMFLCGFLGGIGKYLSNFV